jgi:hypothetical protein
VPKDDAIRVMTDFRDGETFAPIAGGETLYFGWSYEVHADANSYENYFFCRVKPSGDGFVGFATNLKTDGWQEDGDAHDIVKRLRKGDALPPSPAVKYMRSTEPDGGWYPLAATDGKSKALAAPSPLWLRRSSDGGRLLIVQKLPTQSPSRTTPYEAAGRYVELWKVP